MFQRLLFVNSRNMHQFFNTSQSNVFCSIIRLLLNSRSSPRVNCSSCVCRFKIEHLRPRDNLWRYLKLFILSYRARRKLKAEVTLA